MQKRILLFFIALLSFDYSFSQIEPVTGLKYLDNGKFDSVFRRNYPNTIPYTYFLLTFNPSLSALTLAPEMIKAYKEIRWFDKDVPIYIVYLNSGVVSNVPGDEEIYFKEIFYIHQQEDKNVFFIQSDLLYDSLNIGTLMTKWFYVYHYRLIGANSIKLHSLSEYNYNFPKDIISISEPRKIKIYPGNLRLSINRDIIRPYLPDKLFYITDMNNNLHVLDINTGQFVNTFNKKSYSPVDFYCEYISKSKQNCNIAKMGYSMEYNRDPSYFAGALYSGDNIYISTGFELMVPWENTRYGGLKYATYVNELGEKQKFRYATFGETYLTLLKLDTSLNLLDIYYINTNSYPEENKVPQKAGFWGGLDKGFFIKDSILIMDNNPDTGIPIKKLPQKSKYAYSIFKLDDKNTYYFKEFLPIEYEKNHTKYMDWHNRTYYFQLKENIYANLLNGGYINKLNGNYNTICLKGLGNELIKEKIPSFREDTIWFRINYRSLSINSIFKGSYALALYYYQDTPTLEVLEENISGNLKTVQVMDLSRIEGFSTLEFSAVIPNNGDGLCINDDKIYLTRFEKGEYFLYEYPIILRKKEIDPSIEYYKQLSKPK